MGKIKYRVKVVTRHCAKLGANACAFWRRSLSLAFFAYYPLLCFFALASGQWPDDCDTAGGSSSSAAAAAAVSIDNSPVVSLSLIGSTTLASQTDWNELLLKWGCSLRRRHNNWKKMKGEREKVKRVRQEQHRHSFASSSSSFANSKRSAAKFGVETAHLQSVGKRQTHTQTQFASVCYIF